MSEHLTCETCRFGVLRWRKGDKYDAFNETTYESRESERYSTQVECRRFAPRGPVVFPEDTRDYAVFPSVDGDAWCGEGELHDA